LIVEEGRDCPNFRVSENGTVPLIALDSAKACIIALAEKLGLSGSERRSYLELLLEK